MKLSRWAMSLFASIALISTIAEPLASADSTSSTSVITVTSGTSQYSSEVTLDSATPLTASQVQSLTQSIDSLNWITKPRAGQRSPGNPGRFTSRQRPKVGEVLS